MERIGVRELRQHASRWLARVAAGETIEVTDRGKLVAVISPPQTRSAYERLLETGRLLPAERDLLAVEPLEDGDADPLSRELDTIREGEREF